jgi:SAM-dependent methyltransferase
MSRRVHRGGSMRRFWDRRAREDAPFFVDNRLAYGSGDLEAIWAEGESALRTFGDLLGIEVRADDTVVEIGCGIGRMTRAIAARAGRVLAVDVSTEMLREARRLSPQLDNVTWIAGDGVSLAGIDDASADAAISHVVFQHIPDPRITLGYVRELGRVLAPGGWAALHVSDEPAIHAAPGGGPLRRARRGVRDALGRGPRGQASPFWLGSAVDLDRLAATARASGTSVERVTGAGTQFCLVLLRRERGR